MKKVTLFFALSSLLFPEAYSAQVICKKGSFQPLDPSAKGSPFVVLEKTRQTSDKDFCIAEGFYAGVATPDEVKRYEEQTNQSLVLTPAPVVSQSSSNPIGHWIWAQKNSNWTGEVCERPLEKNQEELLNSLKIISSNIACESLGFSEDGNKNNPDKKINYTPPLKKKKHLSNDTSKAFNQISSCFCLSKVGQPLKSDSTLTDEYIGSTTEFVKKEYINNLISTRLYEFSLAKNILTPEGKKACEKLSTDKELKNIVEEKLQIPSVIKAVFNPLKEEEATALYNLGKPSEGNEVTNTPVISTLAFNNFAKRWTCALNGAEKESAKDSNKIHETVELIQEIHKAKKIEVNGQTLAKVKHIAACGTISISAVEESYLEKMLSTPLGSENTTLLEKIGKKLKGTQVTEENFAQAFKDLIAEHLNTQCERSRVKLSKLGSGNYSAVFSEPELIDYLVSKSPKHTVEIQKQHCSMMQQQLNENPETFLEEFCHYKKGDRLPPAGCPAIGDFLKANFVEFESIGSISPQANEAAHRPNVAQIMSKLRHAGTSEYSGAASMVRVDSAATLSSIVKTAGERFTSNKNESFNMDMDSFSINPKASNASFSKPSSNTLNNSNFSSMPNQQHTQPPFGTNDVKAYQGFNQEFKPNQEQVNSNNPSTPNIVFESKNTAAQAGTVITPKPTAAPVVATTVLERVVTPTPDASSKEEKKAVSSTNAEEKSKKAESKIEVAKSENTPTSATPISISNKAAAAPPAISARAPSFQEAARNPVLIPEEAIRKYVEARKFEHSIVVKKDGFDTKNDGVADLLPPETGLMLNAFKTGKIAGKDVTKISIGDEIKDLKAFEQTNTFHGAVVLVEDQAKKERYICRAFITDAKDGVEKLLPVNAVAPTKDELGGYKCTTERKTQEVTPSVTKVEKKEAQKALTSNERLYKAFVLDRIIKGSTKEEPITKKK